ncbi:ADP-L-glycero-D-manno-heptose-6-epimerase [Streptomyces badius]
MDLRGRAPFAIIIIDRGPGPQTAEAGGNAARAWSGRQAFRLAAMTWLITGGAGYIGAHVARAMVAAGERVVVLDDRSSGVVDRLPDAVTLVEGSASDRALLDRVLAGHAVSGVVHLAAKKQVGESVEKPLLYYRENVAGLAVLLEAVVAAGVRRFLFSSSAAVYGVPDVDLITEERPASPSTRTARRSSPVSGWCGPPARRTGSRPPVCGTSTWRERPRRSWRTPGCSTSCR